MVVCYFSVVEIGHHDQGTPHKGLFWAQGSRVVRVHAPPSTELGQQAGVVVAGTVSGRAHLGHRGRQRMRYCEYPEAFGT